MSTTINQTIKILYVCGIVPEWPVNLRPLPPLDSGAPHGNILRLVEELARTQYSHDIVIKVISASSSEQYETIIQRWPPSTLQGDYSWVTISLGLRKYSAWLFQHSSISFGLLNTFFGSYSLQAVAYLRELRRIYHEIKPNFVLLDDGPQYIRGLAHFVPQEHLLFYCRGDMGSSRNFLHYPNLVLVTNKNLGHWVKKINPQVQRIAIVPNSLPYEFMAQDWDPSRFCKQRRNVLFVGRLNPVKGLHYLIQAFARIQKEFKNTRLVIVGAEHPSGDNRKNVTEYENLVRTLAKNLLPPNSVEWKGWLSLEELLKTYQDAYLAAYPSTCIEGFGMVALEAMACGLPVIVSDQPGFASIVSQGGGMIVKEPTNINDLSDALQYLLDNPIEAQRLGQEAYQIARNYTVQQAMGSFTEAIKSIMNSINL